MAEDKNNQVKELPNQNELIQELEKTKAERDQYKEAYEQLSEQNSNIWGLYSNTVDYIINNTVRKRNR